MRDNIKTDKTIPMAERYPLNMDKDIFDSWQTMKRYGDNSLIANKCNICATTVTRALKYGHVNDPKLILKISKFFSDRIDKEKGLGTALTTKANEEVIVKITSFFRDLINDDKEGVTSLLSSQKTA